MIGSSASLDRLEAELGQLVADHAARRDLSEFARYADDPLGFLRDVLHVERLWDRQEQIALAVRDHAQTVVVGCNASGKDYIAARLALWWTYARRGFVSITGPTERQVKAVCFAELARAFAGAPELPGKLFELALKLDGAGHAGIGGYTASEASRATGVHAPRLLVIATEAQALEPWAWEAIFANATGDDARILALGNPLFPTGKFAEFARSPHWHCVTMPATEHPNVLTGQNVIPGAVTRAGVDRIAAEYGVGSSVYNSRVLARFPTEAAEALVARAWLDASAARHAAHPDVPLAFGETAVLAVDVGRFGGDRSVLAIRHDRHLQHLILLPRLDTMATAKRIVAEAEARGYHVRGRAEDRRFPGGEQPHDLVVVDEAGLGAGVLDRLVEMGVHVRGFNGARSPQYAPAVVHNCRAEALWGLRQLLEAGEIDLPHDGELFEELAVVEWLLNKQTGLVQILGKEEIRQQLGRSPDRSDAVSMAFHGMWRPAGGRYWRTLRVSYA